VKWEKSELDLIEKYFNKNLSELTLFKNITDINPNRTYGAVLRKIYDFKEQGWDKKPHLKHLRVGYLDLECTGLQANFAHILSWYIKAKGQNKYYSGVITKKEIFDGEFDKRIVKELLEAFSNFDILYTHYGCLTPGHHILTSNLKWFPVENLKIGDELLAFENETEDSKRKFFKKSIVTANQLILKDCYTLYLSDGTTLTASEDHPFLRRNGACMNIWTTPKKINEWFNGKKKQYGKIHFNRLLPVWENETYPYERGYLSGLFDGEGCLYQRNYNKEQLIKSGSYGKHAISLNFAQTENNVLLKGMEYLKLLGFDCISRYSKKTYAATHKPTCAVYVRGGLGKIIEFLGRIRPTRLLEKFNPDLLGKVQSREKGLYLENIEYIGKKMVCGLSTSTHTYIAEGFACHNSDYRFDVPFLRTRAYRHDLENMLPRFMEKFVLDTYPIAKAKLKLHSNRLDAIGDALNITGIKKTPLSPSIWEMGKIGDQKALEYICLHNRRDVQLLERIHKKLATVENPILSKYRSI